MKKGFKPHIEIRIHEYDDAIFITGWASVRFYLKRKRHIPFFKDESKKKWNYRKHFTVIPRNKLKRSERKEIIDIFKRELANDIYEQFKQTMEKLRRRWDVVKIENAI